MISILEHYKILGVSVGASIAEVTSSYRRLSRIYHPDINNDPESEEKMKRINIAYAALREKLRREAAVRDRVPYSRTARRYAGTDTRTQGAETRKVVTVSEKEAFAVITSYFEALSVYDYSRAYDYLSAYDKRHITRDSFIKWRTSVSRLFPMREFNVESRSSVASVVLGDDRVIPARKFTVMVKEEDSSDHVVSSGSVEKLIINENGFCKVFLGYMSVGELTQNFDERFEAGRKRDLAKRLDEYYDGLHTEIDMFNPAGMRRAVMHELYRHKRFGGRLTFAAISVKADRVSAAGQEELARSAAMTINSTLRETDIPGYLGDGVFAILFVELRRKNADEIINRLVERIKANAGVLLGQKADISFAFESWSGNGIADMESLNKVLMKFRKKL